jgi:hypothetical protein
MSGRNPGWTLVDIVGKYQDPAVVTILAVTSSDWGGTVDTGTLGFPNVLPGDVIKFHSGKHYRLDSDAGGGTSPFIVGISENSFNKGGVSTYRTLYEHPYETSFRNEHGAIFNWDTSASAMWLIQSAGDFQVHNPTTINTAGDLDTFLLNHSYEALELWRPVLPNTNGFNPSFPTLVPRVIPN